jgi:hypothetical protein
MPWEARVCDKHGGRTRRGSESFTFTILEAAKKHHEQNIRAFSIAYIVSHQHGLLRLKPLLVWLRWCSGICTSWPLGYW